MLRDILLAYKELIKNGTIHRDIKPENILVHTENNLKKFKLADFGFARTVHLFIYK
jgi:serine/threonine protein kinase